MSVRCLNIFVRITSTRLVSNIQGITNHCQNRVLLQPTGKRWIRPLQLIKMSTGNQTNSQANVEHLSNQHEFVYKIGNDKAYLDYQFDKDGVMDMQHTIVPQAFQGQGVGKLLAQAAFDYAKENNLKMRLTCPFLKNYLDKNPKEEWKKLVVA